MSGAAARTASSVNLIGHFVGGEACRFPGNRTSNRSSGCHEQRCQYRQKASMYVILAVSSGCFASRHLACSIYRRANNCRIVF